MRHVSDEVLALLKQWEGFVPYAYDDADKSNPKRRIMLGDDVHGTLTIGYGHTGREVHGGLVITQDQANLLLESDVAGAVACVNRAVTIPIAQCQFDAMVDFVFNLGCARLLGSTLLRYVNAGEFDLAAGQFPLWDHAGGVVVAGLLARRNAEAELFQSCQT